MKRVLFQRYRGRVYHGKSIHRIQMRVRSPLTFHLGSFYTWLMMAPWRMGG